MEHQSNRSQQGGTGSGEQTDRSRNQQKSTGSSSEKSGIASQIGAKESEITTIADMGGFSGRDDAAGGSGDRMENESSGETTDKP